MLMSSSPQHSNKGFLSSKLGVVIMVATVLLIVVSVAILTRQEIVDHESIPSFDQAITLKQDQTDVSPIETLQQIDNELNAMSEPTLASTQGDVPSSIAPQKEFPVLTISSEDEAAQLAQAKAAATAAERFNREKQSRLNVVLNEDAGELESLAKVEISYLLKQWQDAWAAGNTNLYMSFYSDNFVPENKQSLSQWQAKRRNRVIPSKSADITLSNFQVSFEDNLNTGVVELDQHYKSGKYNDRARKKLVFAKESLGWKLVAEIILRKDS